ncbi:amidohydrolase family protein [Arthrobacter pigmenti]
MSAPPSPVILPAAVNAHSHAFHRVLRGRTHTGRGSFWSWREQMYRHSAALTPELYEKLATAVYAEMVTAGFSAVGEFHYLHHRPDGTPYPDHDMEHALARAARNAGIRLTLLDTCYLFGGIGQPLNDEQSRFADDDASSWLARLESLREAFEQTYDPEFVTVGAALHSVRAVDPPSLHTIAEQLNPDLPLHVHLSEQPAENQACLDAYGLTPTQLLAKHGLLSERLSAVHATHLTERDIALLGRAGANIVMCPTTEADLADGIGPALELASAGAVISLGTDQHAVVDPLLEMRALEHGERLRSGERGRFTPGELVAASSTAGGRSLRGHRMVHAHEDYIRVRSDSVRTAGADADQIVLAATASDVETVVINGQVVARNGIHESLGDPAILLTDVLKELE